MTTPLYPTFRQRIENACDRLIEQQVTPWSLMAAGMAAGHPFHVKSFDGTDIRYQGIDFEGSPSLVFWSGYIEPFLEHLCTSEIEAAVSMSKANGVGIKNYMPILPTLLQILN